jgi:membrane protease YdiL (CAAX protease family)
LTTTISSHRILRLLVVFLWLVLSLFLCGPAAQSLTTRFNLPTFEPLIGQVFLLILLLLGFSLLNNRAPIRDTNALPKRSTTKQEFSRGAALGWAMLLLAMLPMALTGSLHLAFTLNLPTLGLTLLSLATLALTTLALAVAFRGYIFRLLIDSTSPTVATLIVSITLAAASVHNANATALSVLATFLFSILLAITYLRTHALWLGWGLHFAWATATAVLFGLPVAGNASYTSILSTDTTGPTLLTGGPYGPEAAGFTLLVLLAAVPVLYRITRDYEWQYTHAPIIPAGYEVTIAPPAAHTAMETAAAAPAPLVQILGSTPTSASTLPVIDDHLRSDRNPGTPTL